MVEKAKYYSEAQAYKETADMMKSSIEKQYILSDTHSWKRDSFGFFHDPVITMLSDVYGYSLDDSPEEFSSWFTASRNSYKEDISGVSAKSYFGPSGIGYDHSMITQNALLTDHMEDASILMESLCKICYSPRLPEPYLTPEGMTI